MAEMKEPKFPEFAIFDSTFKAMRERLYFEHWRNADLKEKLRYAHQDIKRLKHELTVEQNRAKWNGKT